MTDASLLLRILGDPDDGQQAIRAVARDVAALGKQRAKATIKVATEKARADVQGFKALLASIRNKDVVIDAEIRGIEALERARARFTNFSEGLRDARVSIGPVSASLRTVLALIGAAVPILVALTSGLAAMTAAAAAAAGGIGALGVAFASLLVPAVLLGIGVVRRFQEESDKAGTAAHSLSRAAAGLGKAFDSAMGKGADAVFRGAASALTSLRPVISGLKGEFTGFGQAVGSSLRTLGVEFSSPTWTAFFSRLVEAATSATPILTSAFTSLARIFRNIADAAMPALLRGLESMADGLSKLADSTSDVDQLRSTIEGLVDHTRSWGELFKQVGRIVLGFFKAAAPEGKSIVDSLAAAAKRTADFVNSAKGMAAIRGFLADMRPILDSVANLFAKLGPLATEWAQLMAPLIPPLVDLLTLIVEVLTEVLDALNGLPGPIQAVVAAFLLFRGPIGMLRTLASLLGGGALIGGLGKLAGAARTAAQGVGTGIAALGGLGPAGVAAAGALGVVAAGYAGAKSEAGKAAQEFAKSGLQITTYADYLRGLRASLDPAASALRNVGLNAMQAGNGFKITTEGMRVATQGAKLFGNSLTAGIDSVRSWAQTVRKSAGSASQGFKTAGAAAARLFAGGLQAGKGAAAGAGRQLGQAAQQAARQSGNALRSVGAAVGRLFASGVQSARGQASGAGKGISDAARTAAQSAGRALQSVGSQVGNLFAQGVRSSAGAASSAAQEVGRAAESAFQSVGASIAAAGTALANNFASGIRAGIGAAVAAAQELAGAVRAQMPGSEPKDPRSPLRRLGDAGRATVANFAKGIREGRGALTAAARDAMAGAAFAPGKGAGWKHKPSGDWSAGTVGPEWSAGDPRRPKPPKVDPQAIIDALSESLDGLRAFVVESVGKLGTFSGDLGETIKRVFAEGATGFQGGSVKSGDLAGSMISGLPVQSWLEQLVGEIQGEIGSTLDNLAIAASPPMAPAAAITPAGVSRAPEAQEVIHYDINAPLTGGEVDPVAVMAEIRRHERRRGRAGRRGR